jgi:hypothetical protein
MITKQPQLRVRGLVLLPRGIVTHCFVEQTQTDDRRLPDRFGEDADTIIISP